MGSRTADPEVPVAGSSPLDQRDPRSRARKRRLTYCSRVGPGAVASAKRRTAARKRIHLICQPANDALGLQCLEVITREHHESLESEDGCLLSQATWSWRVTALDKRAPGRDEAQPDLVQAFGKRGPRRSVVLELRRRPFSRRVASGKHEMLHRSAGYHRPGIK